MKKLINIVGIILITLVLLGSCSAKDNAEDTMATFNENINKSTELIVSIDKNPTTITDKKQIESIAKSISALTTGEISDNDKIEKDGTTYVIKKADSENKDNIKVSDRVLEFSSGGLKYKYEIVQ